MLEKLGPSADIVDFNIRNTHMKHCLVTAGCVIFELNQKYIARQRILICTLTILQLAQA